MKRPLEAAVLAFGLLIAHAAAAEGDASTRHAPLLDGGKDRIVRSAFVPSKLLPQGEVLLIRRGDAAVVQTVLYSRYLKRVVADIRGKERAIWTPEREGHADSVRYVEALLAAADGVERRAREGNPRGDRRRKLLIEFILSGKAALMALFEPEIEEREGHYRVTAKRPIAVLELSRTYVRGNIYEIAWDALGMTRKESKAVLDPMLPPETAGEEPQSEPKVK